ncbi:uncharacterized protein Dwil_GK14548 [Drosophila willistoni]|uniref:BZIP domain-containing protein n=1 Tax=Drosophila willistoni TaxID=7260 RepID=B4MX10_DROWI|nr:putative uncharacterized protein DDB_G0268364 [Drosophila willistoni]EDW76649.2 uncharacterized protein Dwil_GK14548 [Drosophila willistoni]
MENITQINQSTYTHKKFSANKRQREMDYLLEQNKENEIPQGLKMEPSTKRRQTKGFFRPWLDNEQNREVAATTTPPPAPVSKTVPVSQYHANMVRQSVCRRQRSPKEQQRRDRNTLACLLSRRAKQAQEQRLGQQYEQYRAQQSAILEQQVRLSLYYRQLLQQAIFQQGISAPEPIALPQQQQQFLQQMALSQQMLIFGAQH